MTEFKPMSFEDGANTEIRVGGFTYMTTSLDLQDGGVLFDYTDVNPPFAQRRVFIPWANVGSVSQPIQE